MKKLNTVVALLGLGVLADAQGISANVNGRHVSFQDVQPLMMSGHVMVPVRGIFEMMDVQMNWDEGAQTLTANQGPNNIRLTINSAYATVNDKQVYLDAPVRMVRGRTMVPLRFLSESLGATVDWVGVSRTVEINTKHVDPRESTGYKMVTIRDGVVLPFIFDGTISSNQSVTGDKFTARIDTRRADNYQGLPMGTVLQGHVSYISPRRGNIPGVLGISFDIIRFLDRKEVPISSYLVQVDLNAAEDSNKPWVAQSDQSSPNLKYVGYSVERRLWLIVDLDAKGPIAGKLEIQSAMGRRYNEILQKPSLSRDVTIERGTRGGIRLTQDLIFRVPTNQ